MRSAADILTLALLLSAFVFGCTSLAVLLFGHGGILRGRRR